MTEELTRRERIEAALEVALLDVLDRLLANGYGDDLRGLAAVLDVLLADYRRRVTPLPAGEVAAAVRAGMQSALSGTRG